MQNVECRSQCVGSGTVLKGDDANLSEGSQGYALSRLSRIAVGRKALELGSSYDSVVLTLISMLCRLLGCDAV
jgi:hypothetical protein